MDGELAVHEDLRAALAGDDFETIRRLLATVVPESLSPLDYEKVRRTLDRVSRPGKVRVAYLGNFTMDLLPDYVAVLGAREGIGTSSYLGAFGQYTQEVLDEKSGLHAHAPDLVFLALSLRQLERERMARFGDLDAAERRALREDVLEHLVSWTVSARERLSATLVVANFPAPGFPGAGIADATSPYGEGEFYLELNLEMLRRFKGEPRVQVFDADRVAARHGKDRVIDPRMLYLARMEWAPGFLPAMAQEILRHVKAARNLTRKCLVLDLDGTLWGGVVGEDGPAGVRVGPGNPEGEAHLDFQHRVKDLQRRGILLAVCSKNNPEEAMEVFRTRPEMPLREEDFAALEIGWAPKHQGVRRIAERLGIGLDSLVFVDDNPAEAELIRQMLPEVEVGFLPADPADHAAWLERATWFEKPTILAEDARKTAQYEEQRHREALRADAGDLETYLYSLDTQVRIRSARGEDLARVHQLFAKTNQFNLTTIRYSLGELEAFQRGANSELGVVWARDRFGELGTIGAWLLVHEEPALRLDSFVLSCRALGRGIETAVMNHVKARLGRGRFEHLAARFLPSGRNTPAEGFLDAEGFLRSGLGPEGSRLYALSRSEIAPRPCGWIRVLP